jgi:hypothetical protein
MQRVWFRSFAEQHLPMLYWLAGGVIAVIGITLTLRSGIVGGTFALLMIPLVLLAGLAAGLVELVQALRDGQAGAGAVMVRIAGTAALGILALPLAATLSFTTFWIADYTAIIGAFPTYQQVVADVQHGAIMPTGAWQEQGAVLFIAEATPERIVFRLTDKTMPRRGIVYDPTGDVMTNAPTYSSDENPQHRIGRATVENCRTALITAYYRCDVWDFDAD